MGGRVVFVHPLCPRTTLDHECGNDPEEEDGVRF